jgi:hypothetical protein
MSGKMSNSYVSMIHELIKYFPQSEIYGITNLLRRANVSILEGLRCCFEYKEVFTIGLKPSGNYEIIDLFHSMATHLSRLLQMNIPTIRYNRLINSHE